MFGMIGPEVKSGDEPTVPGHGTVIHEAHTPFGEENSGTRKTTDSLKSTRSRLPSIS